MSVDNRDRLDRRADTDTGDTASTFRIVLIVSFSLAAFAVLLV